MITFILNFIRYQKLKPLNAELDILLKAAALKEKNIQLPEHIQLFIKQLYKNRRNNNEMDL